MESIENPLVLEVWDGINLLFVCGGDITTTPMSFFHMDPLGVGVEGGGGVARLDRGVQVE